ncbi:MFS transporter [Propioniciclava coleopterorum]|uniref:MFS transporter n=1 Tax=Propioniciclava coleopterorum TaxID=2714937 RepID=A0A6G7Y5K8_9ACTN|nr:MFS transporter [Propioniciclava coleopterorum]QIK71999.1 MFS transporter [Propioniciclava coleopterorum]
MSDTATTSSGRRSIFSIPGVSGSQLRAAAVGNLIEWFDWNAYAFLAVYFSSQFFPKDSPPLVALLGTFGIMAVGFIMRPISGLIIGWVADRLGRKVAMLITVWGMGIASLLIGLAPTFEQVGVLAPVILLLARATQGICIGGEYASMSAFAMEMTPTGKRGFIAGILGGVAALGQVAVTLIIVLLANILSHEQMVEFGWRIVFVVGGLLSIWGIILRRGMHDTVEKADRPRTRSTLGSMFRPMREHPKETVRVIGLTIGFTAMVYAWGAYMPTYATTYAGLDPRFTMIAMLVTSLTLIVATPLAGILSDKVGRRPTMLAAGIILAVATVPALGLLNDQLWRLILIQAAGNLVIALLQASSMPAYSEMFPTQFRAAGFGFPYALTVGLVGGTVPMVGTQLASMGAGHMFPWYLVALIVISIFFYATMKETAFQDMPD